MVGLPFRGLPQQAAESLLIFDSARSLTCRHRLRKYPVAVALRKKLPKPQPRPQGRLLTFQGETMNLSQWVRRLGCSKQCLQTRLKTMPVAKALAMPVSDKRKHAGRKAYRSRIAAD